MDEKEVRAAVTLVDANIDFLKSGVLTISEGVDVGSFILSGGKVIA
ncbi:hypothetical protein SAMN05444166_1342 [Singulisphaera sp. GP187]|nr:hypothetical protein [Singulisphaera sp. GP187]SIN86598.1 hypothetical protein SAMN05444166_1342 [Singulisphaera sp. GP187]